jgi:hypothetical protein
MNFSSEIAGEFIDLVVVEPQEGLRKGSDGGLVGMAGGRVGRNLVLQGDIEAIFVDWFELV